MLLTVRWAHLIYVANLAIDTSVPIRELTTRSSIVSSIIAHTPSHACMSRDPPIQGCTYVIVCDATLRAKVVYATDALRLIRLYIDTNHHGSTTSRGSKVFTADTQYNEIWHPREIRSPVVVRSIGLLTYGVGQLSRSRLRYSV